MKCSFELTWADFRMLDSQNFFGVTKMLADLEQAIDVGMGYVEKGKPPWRDSTHWSRRCEYPWAFISLHPYSRTEVVLDAGSDGSPFQFGLATQAGKVYSLDNRPGHSEMVTAAAEVLKLDNVIPIAGDITKMPFQADFFDKVFCISVLEHIPKKDIEPALGELIRVTKPGGSIALTMDVIIDKADLTAASSDFQLDLVDVLSLSRRCPFAIPTIMESSMKAWIDNLYLVVGCMLIRKEVSHEKEEG